MNKNLYATSIFDQLKRACADEWEDYCHHDFVNEVGAGTLPIESFRYYLEQDYIFLIHFSRAWALAVYKSSSVSDMQWATEILHSTLNTEMNLHVLFSERFGVSQAQLESSSEAQANLAYTRYVLDKGLAGDVLDLYVALMPCVVGYAEIGNRLALEYDSVLEENPYREWIEMYSSEEYQELAIKTISVLERISRERGGMARIEELKEIFRTATVLEEGFWSLCYNPSQQSA
ncbi:MAG: thiaminase II [Gammaproteobacteria bacterium]|nr:thiaminase II [Gammaproteobacteria bacterium]